MNTPHRLALVLSSTSLGLAALALFCARDGSAGPAPRPRSSAVSAEPGSSQRTEALAVELGSLRRELTSLRAALERGEVGSGAATPTPSARESMLPPALSAAQAPAEFELRRELLTGFRGLDAGDRKDALEELAGLARWGDPEARALLVQSLADESAGVRARALKELAGLDKAGLGEHLRATLHDPSAKVRELVANRLGHLPVEEAGPLLLDLLGDRDPKVVLQAIQSARRLDYAAARPLLTRQLQAPNIEVATRAAEALMKLGDRGAASPTIARVLQDFASDGVSGRVRSVKRLGRLRAVSQLEGILAGDESLAVRDEARSALARLEK